MVYRKPDNDNGNVHFFAGANKKDTPVYAIDYVTPHEHTPCVHTGCNHPAIPVTGFCPEHDPVCLNIVAAYLRAKLKREQAEQAKLEALPSIIPPVTPQSLVVVGPTIGQAWDDPEIQARMLQ